MRTLSRARVVQRLASLVLLLAAALPASADPLDGQRIVAVTVSGLRAIQERVVLAQIESLPGTAYRRAIADRDVARLHRLNVFSEVSLTPVEADGGVRVEISLVETLRILPALSLALTDQNGASLGPAVKVLSLRGQPHEMSATVRFGGETLVQFSETSPFLTRQRLWHTADVTLASRHNELEAFNERSVDFDARVGVRSSERWKTGAIVQFYGVRSDVSGVTLSADDSDAFAGFGVVSGYDSRDSWSTPRRGWLNSIDAVWHSGSGSFGTLNLDVRRYQPLSARHTVLTTSLLTLQSGERGVDVPAYMDYALGGENTVRGWDFAARRGKDQFIGSLEYRFTALPTRTVRVKGWNFYAGVALAAFADVGSAWNAGPEFSGGVIGGGGIGLRIFFPFVQVVRLDFSIGNGASHLGLGIGEKADAQRNRVR